ncbi:MAG TPA: transporter substrate-binding domain-containing protein [Hyphomicrobiaceae bacterium]|jgi:polar amino acid transport system substrate-binding protein|nr:transporter substrate-binding domain-containing protein [Hyphomicrobiaceae bacterium]
MRSIAVALLVSAVLELASAGAARADDAAAKQELASTGKVRVGIAVAPTPGAGNVARDAGSGYRGVAVDLGTELAQKLGVPVEFVPYAHSGALTDAAASGAWDVAFIPVDAQRKQKVDFGSAHIVLQSTYLVRPGVAIATLADVDKAGVRVAGVENTATARAAAASLKTVTPTLAKNAEELFELLQSGQADAIALSRESLTQLAAKLPGSRVLDGAYLNSYVAIAVPKGRPAALAYASAFVDAAIASGSVRRALDNIGMQTSTVAPPGTKP